MIDLNLFATVVDWYMSNMNYLTIILLMTIESSFIPFPSEVVVPPAAWLAAQGELNVYLVALSASVGSMLGAIINYYLALWLGRALVYKLADSNYARLFLINREKIEKAENYFIENGNASTFIGRLIPGIRQLISIPAGLARMNLKKFLLYTFLGSSIWNIILTLLGYFFGRNQDALMYYYHEAQWVALGLGVLSVLYLIFFKGKKRKK